VLPKNKGTTGARQRGKTPTGAGRGVRGGKQGRGKKMGDEGQVARSEAPSQAEKKRKCQWGNSQSLSLGKVSKNCRQDPTQVSRMKKNLDEKEATRQRGGKERTDTAICGLKWNRTRFLKTGHARKKST